MSKTSIVRPYTDFIQMLPGNKGLSIDENCPFDAYEEAVRVHSAIIADGLWALGDLFIFGERKWGEKYSQVLDGTKYTEKTLKNATWVCSQFPPSRRHKALTFNHHMAVAALEPADREAILTEAETKDLTVKEVTEIKKAKFPKKAKTKKEGVAEVPEESKGERIGMEEAMDHSNKLISWLEQQDSKIKFLPEAFDRWEIQFRSIKKNARRMGWLGGNN